MDFFLHWLHAFAIPTIFIGGFLEGETVTILAASLASVGAIRIPLPVVALTTALGAYTGHVVFFFLGRTQGKRVLDRFPHMEIHYEQARAFFRKYGTLGIFIAQYIYGLRIAFAITIGISEIPVRKFLILQLLSCMIWGALVTTGGAIFGTALERVLGEYAWVGWATFGLVVAGAVIAFVWHLRRDAHARREYAKRISEHSSSPTSTV